MGSTSEGTKESTLPGVIGPNKKVDCRQPGEVSSLSLGLFNDDVVLGAGRASEVDCCVVLNGEPDVGICFRHDGHAGALLTSAQASHTGRQFLPRRICSEPFDRLLASEKRPRAH